MSTRCALCCLVQPPPDAGLRWASSQMWDHSQSLYHIRYTIQLRSSLTCWKLRFSWSIRTWDSIQIQTHRLLLRMIRWEFLSMYCYCSMTGGQIIEKNTRIRLKIVGTRVDATEIVSQVQTLSSMKVAKAQRSSRLALSRRTTLVSLINSVDSRVGFHVYRLP